MGKELWKKAIYKERMLFKDDKHEQFYHKRLTEVKNHDCYHKALIYLLGISEETRKYFRQVYDIQSGCIKPECLHQGWQTGRSRQIIRLAFNLYTNRMPSVDESNAKEDLISECKGYLVTNIFCCEYARYFWEGIRLRFPEYTGFIEGELVWKDAI